jgi:hypothetical protein
MEEATRFTSAMSAGVALGNSRSTIPVAGLVTAKGIHSLSFIDKKIRLSLNDSQYRD